MSPELRADASRRTATRLHEYRAAGGLRYRLGTTRQGTDSRQRAAQLGQHRRIGLDRDDFGAQRDQRGG